MQFEAYIREFTAFLKDFIAQMRGVHVDRLELKWISISLAVIGFLIFIITADAFIHNVNPPSKVETIDSARLHLSKEFTESNLGVQVDESGDLVVRMVAGRYSFFPKHISVPAETKVKFRWVSMDVLHGVHIPMTNMSTMIVPGYVAEISTAFPKPGEYPVLCNEYCGLGHNHMWSNISVIAKEEWQAPVQKVAENTPAENKTEPETNNE